MQTLKVLFFIQSAKRIWLHLCRNICSQSIGHWGPAIDIRGAAVTHTVVSASLTLSTIPLAHVHTNHQVCNVLFLRGLSEQPVVRTPELGSLPTWLMDTATKREGTGEFNHPHGNMSQVDRTSWPGLRIMDNLLWGSEPGTYPNPPAQVVSRCVSVQGDLLCPSEPGVLPLGSSALLSSVLGLLRIGRETGQWLVQKAQRALLSCASSLVQDGSDRVGQCLSSSCSQPRYREQALSCQGLSCQGPGPWLLLPCLPDHHILPNCCLTFQSSWGRASSWKPLLSWPWLWPSLTHAWGRGHCCPAPGPAAEQYPGDLVVWLT